MGFCTQKKLVESTFKKFAVHRTRVFKIQGNKKLPNPPDWTVTQVVKFLKVSPVGEMLENQDWMS